MDPTHSGVIGKKNTCHLSAASDIKSSKWPTSYHQEVNMLKWGRMPAIFVIDREGVIRYGHYG